MTTTLKVRATKELEPGALVGFYDNQKRREGDEFELLDASHFSSRWMRPLGWTPEGWVEPEPKPEEVEEEEEPPRRSRRNARQAS